MNVAVTIAFEIGIHFAIKVGSRVESRTNFLFGNFS